jgi:hypothetical protein
VSTLRVLLSSVTELQLRMSLCRALVQCRSLLRARARRRRCSLRGMSLGGGQRRGCWRLPSGLFRRRSYPQAGRDQVPCRWSSRRHLTGPRLRRPEGGCRREPDPPPGAGTLRGGPRLEVGGSGPGGSVLAASAQGTPVVAASVKARKAKGPAGDTLEWPYVNLKGPVQSESGRAPVPIARRSTAQQL